jgi:hypothetical protein
MDVSPSDQVNVIRPTPLGWWTGQQGGRRRLEIAARTVRAAHVELLRVRRAGSD